MKLKFLLISVQLYYAFLCFFERYHTKSELVEEHLRWISAKISSPSHFTPYIATPGFTKLLINDLRNIDYEWFNPYAAGG